MVRLIKIKEAFEWQEYETNEKLLPYEPFEYKGIVSEIYIKENNEKLKIIFRFIERDENIGSIIKSIDEKIIFSFFKKDIVGFRKMDLFLSLDGFIETESDPPFLSYKFKNPLFIGWYLKKSKDIDILVFLDASNKYEIIVKKGIVPIITKNMIGNIEEEKTKIRNLRFFWNKNNVNIEKKHMMELTSEKIIEKINIIFQSKRNFEYCGIEYILNLKIKIKDFKGNYYIIEYNWEEIGNFQYMKKEDVDIEVFFDEKYDEKKFYFIETNNSKFSKYSDYDNLGIDTDDEQISHKYIFSNMIFEVLVEKGYYPIIYKLK